MQDYNYVYQVDSIEETTPPDSVTGGHWYRYVLRKGNSVMEGKVSGTLKQVTLHVDELVEKINTRNNWGRQKK